MSASYTTVSSRIEETWSHEIHHMNISVHHNLQFQILQEMKDDISERFSTCHTSICSTFQDKEILDHLLHLIPSILQDHPCRTDWILLVLETILLHCRYYYRTHCLYSLQLPIPLISRILKRGRHQVLGVTSTSHTSLCSTFLLFTSCLIEIDFNL